MHKTRSGDAYIERVCRSDSLDNTSQWLDARPPLHLFLGNILMLFRRINRCLYLIIVRNAQINLVGKIQTVWMLQQAGRQTVRLIDTVRQRVTAAEYVNERTNIRNISVNMSVHSGNCIYVRFKIKELRLLRTQCFYVCSLWFRQ